MNIAFVGCGYVADLYMKTLGRHSNLNLIGAWDCDSNNLGSFCQHWGVRPYANLAEFLSDATVEMVLNLTNPRSHDEITRQCLGAGKHVYSEKPLSMNFTTARELVQLAEANGLYLASAPCSVLGETAQTVWKAIKEGVVGRVRLVYANFDDGMIAPNQAPWNWQTDRGVHWPAKDEFEVGCTFEHAGYVLTWLAAFFGPAKSVTAFASCQLPDKGISVGKMAPDFSSGCIEYDHDVIARVTCGLVAPRDKSLTVIGDKGVLYVNNVRDEKCPVYYRAIPSSRVHAVIERRINDCRAWLQSYVPTVMWSGRPWQLQRKYPFARRPTGRYLGAHKDADFFRGPVELAEAIQQRRPCRLSAQLGLHLTELVETLQYPERFNWHREIQSSFDPIEPLAWDNEMVNTPSRSVEPDDLKVTSVLSKVPSPNGSNSSGAARPDHTSEIPAGGPMSAGGVSAMATKTASAWYISRMRRQGRVLSVSWQRWNMLPPRIRTSFTCRVAEAVDQQARAILSAATPISSLCPAADNRWSLSPSAMLTLYQQLEKRRPRRFVEFGSGISTLILGLYARAQSSSLPSSPVICSLEHDLQWLKQTRQQLEMHGLLPYVELVHAPICEQEMMGRRVATYSVDTTLLSRVAGNDGFALCLIDGPPATIGRQGTLPLVAPYLANEAIILLDDAYRPDEQEAWTRWSAHNPDNLQSSVVRMTARGMLEGTWKSAETTVVH